MQIVAHDFAPHDLVAGHPALDLVNTVTARNTPQPLDWLDSHARLLTWSTLAGVGAPADLARLRKLATAAPRQAARALARVRRFREALHDLTTALVRREPAPPGALAEVEAAWKRALDRSQLTSRAAQIEAAITVERGGLDFVLDALAVRGVELLRDIEVERTRVCLGPQCGWVFIDTSKGGRRVWCDMATCGNVAKSRRHQARARQRR